MSRPREGDVAEIPRMRVAKADLCGLGEAYVQQCETMTVVVVFINIVLYCNLCWLGNL